MKSLSILLLLPAVLFAQEFEFRQEYDTIPVEINGWYPFIPWCGGLSLSNPVMKDLDDDNDLDIICGSNIAFEFYENIGDSLNYNYYYSTQLLEGLSTAGWSAPCLCDIDKDGDFDLFATSDERVWYFENVGNSQNPQFVFITDSLEQIIWWATNIDLVDIDSDGDFDLFTGSGIGTVRFYRNIGNQYSFNISPELYFFESIDVGEHSDPTFCDIDSDNDLDLFIGNEAGRIWFYLNEGDSANYDFVYQTNFYAGIDVGAYASPEFADIDGDGDHDLFVGREQVTSNINPGDIFFYANIGSPQEPLWNFVTRNYITFDEGCKAQLHSTDIDTDNDNDLFFANFWNSISFYENVGDTQNAFYRWITYIYQNIAVSGGHIFFKDIDNDQDPDLFIGETTLPNPPYPGLYLFINRGIPQSASFSLYSSNLIPGDYHVGIAPASADIDADGDNDLFLSDNNGYFYFVQNIGTPTEPVFADTVRDWQNIFTDVCTASCFYDIDDDGDLDLFQIPRNDWNQLFFYRNIGDLVTPVLTLETQFFLEIEGFHTFSGIDIIDIDSDSDGDFLLSTDDGGIVFFRNITGETGVGPKKPIGPPVGKIDLGLGPNPGNPVTCISFTLPSPQEATLAVYNILGARVTTLASGLQPPGEHSFYWNNSQVSSGVYIIRLETVEAQEVRKVVVVK